MTVTTFFTSSGLDGAGAVKPGTTVERIYWTIPGHYCIATDGHEYASSGDAMIAALGLYFEEGRSPDLPMTIDCRWVMRDSASSTDRVAERFTYANQEALAAHVAHRDRLAEAMAGP